MKKKDENELKIPAFPHLGMPINPLGPLITDPFGSYTGVSTDGLEIPVQDADDL